MRRGMVFMGLSFELVGLILGCLYIGSLIDKELGWSGYATAGLAVLGMAGWLIHLVSLLKKFSSEDTTNDKKSNTR